jgi:hypothetical protein
MLLLFQIGFVPATNLEVYGLITTFQGKFGQLEERVIVMINLCIVDQLAR